MDILSLKLDDLTPDPDNARAHDSRNLDAITNSLRRFGQQKPIVVNTANGVVAGNGTVSAALALGWSEIDAVRTELDGDEAALYAIADNRSSELAAWNLPQLDLALADLKLDTIRDLGFTMSELEDLFPPEPIEPDGTEDDVPAIEDDVHSQPGQVYELGPHRLVCGDCTDPKVWDAVVGDERLRCVWTDPPYGVGLNSDLNESSSPERIKKQRKDGLVVSNDAMTPEDTAALWSDAFEQLQRVSEPGSAWYAAAAFRCDLWSDMVPVMAHFGCTRMLVWVKDRFVLGRGDYHYRHEPIFHGWFGGAARLHPVPRDVDTVFECPRPGASKEHPTMKPVDLIRSMIENSSGTGWMVGDPFAGSGSTLIACAMTGRVARLIELDPRYCDVIRRRWTRWAIDHDVDAGSGALDAGDSC